MCVNERNEFLGKFIMIDATCVPNAREEGVMHIPGNMETRSLEAARAGELWQEYLGYSPSHHGAGCASIDRRLLRPVTSGFQSGEMASGTCNVVL